MNWVRFVLISISLLAVVYFTFQLDIWSGSFKNMFFYLSDWRSWIALVALIYAVEGIFKWLLMAEVKATAPRRRIR